MSTARNSGSVVVRVPDENLMYHVLANAVRQAMVVHEEMRSQLGAEDEQFPWRDYDDRVYAMLVERDIPHWDILEAAEAVFRRPDGFAILRDAMVPSGQRPLSTARIASLAHAVVKTRYAERRVPPSQRTTLGDLLVRPVQEWSFDTNDVCAVAEAIGWSLHSSLSVPTVLEKFRRTYGGRVVAMLEASGMFPVRNAKPYTPNLNIVTGSRDPAEHRRADGLVYAVVYAILNMRVYASNVYEDDGDDTIEDRVWMRDMDAVGMVSALRHVVSAAIRCVRNEEEGDTDYGDEVQRSPLPDLVYRAIGTLRERNTVDGVPVPVLRRAFEAIYRIVPRARPATSGTQDTWRFEQPSEYKRQRELEEERRECARLGIKPPVRK